MKRARWEEEEEEGKQVIDTWNQDMSGYRPQTQTLRRDRLMQQTNILQLHVQTPPRSSPWRLQSVHTHCDGGARGCEALTNLLSDQ